MTQITVDLTGIQPGDTIVWSSGNKLVKGPPAIAPRVIYLANGDTLADLGPGQVDGAPASVRIGEEPDDAELRLKWRAASQRWVAAEFEVATSNDAWAIDGINQQPGDVQNRWFRPIHGVGWYHGARATLHQNWTPGDTTIVVHGLVGPFANAGLLMMRGWTPAYTSLTDNADGTWTFAGVTNGPSVTLDANVTPIISYDATNAGDSGGWSINTHSLDHVGELWAAGFRLQERVPLFYMNGSQDGQPMDATLWWFEHNPLTDLFTTPSPYVPPVGALGKSITLTGPSDPMHTAVGAGRVDERGFATITAYESWVNWAAGAPSKRYMKPYLYFRMPTGAKDTGEMYNLHWMMRWIGTP